MTVKQTSKPLEIKISTVPAVSAILHDSDPDRLRSALQEMTAGVTDYFEDDFAVIDVEPLVAQGKSVDWSILTSLFKSFRLNPVAVRNAVPEMEADILAHGLSIDVVAKPRREAASESETPSSKESAAVATPPAAETPPKPRASMIIDTPVRAGQRIYARDADLIVMAAVNNGAEIIADGSIHVYAPLRGRALAGASGNAEARIFSLSMEAELVSIAGIYNTFEDGFPSASVGKPTQVRLVGNRIDLLPINPDAR